MILSGLAILLSISGRSEDRYTYTGNYGYISYDKSDLREKVEKNAISVTQTPYYGNDITVESIGNNKLLISEPANIYRLSLINTKSGNPLINSAELDYGKFHILTDNNEILVIGKSDENCYLYILGPENLRQKYSRLIDFSS